MTPASFRACLLLLPTLLAGIASATPREDLASPDPAVRDQAAAEIRRTFVPIPESKWAPVLAKIHKGQTSEEVLAFFPSDIKSGDSGGSGNAHGSSFQIDDEWNLTLSSTNQDHKVFAWSLTYSPLGFFVEPPPHFTGLWTCYYLNGNKSAEANYHDGEPAGEQLCFHPNGSRRMATTSSPDYKDLDQSQYDIEGSLTLRTIRKHDDPLDVRIDYDAFGEKERRFSPVEWGNRKLTVEACRKSLIAQREVLKHAEELSAAAEERLAATPVEERPKLAEDARQKFERLTPIRSTLKDFERFVENSEQEAAREAAAKTKEAALQAEEASKAEEAEKTAKPKKKAAK